MGLGRTRRALFRWSPLAVTALLIVNCNTEPDGPGTAAIALKPSFENAAAHLLPVSAVQITLLRDDSSTAALDTTVQIPAGQRSFDATFSIELMSSVEEFYLDLLLLNDGDPMFSADEPVTLYSGESEGQEVSPVLRYVGVGYDAVSVRITTTASTIDFGGTVSFQAEAIGGDDNPIAGTPLWWSSSDPSRASFADSTSGDLVAQQVRGPVNVVAHLYTPPTDSRAITVLPVPNDLQKTAGDGQVGQVNLPLPTPITARVVAADGLGVAGIGVQFSVTEGAIFPTSTLTDANGDAQAIWTLGPTQGTQQATAIALGLAPGSDSVEVFTAAAGDVAGDIAAALKELEAQLTSFVTNMVEATSFSMTQFDQFTFQTAHNLFGTAYNAAPNEPMAAFGYAVTTLMVLEDDPGLRSLADSWDTWRLANPNPELRDLTGGMGPFPALIRDHMDRLRDTVKPALLDALGAMNTVTDPNFVFLVTPEMYGETAPAHDTLELDLTEVLAMRAGLEAAIAGIDIALSYQYDPSPYGATNFDAALLPGSNFLMLDPAASGLLSGARTRILTAIGHIRDAMDFLETESDIQTNDILMYDPSGALANCEYEFPCYLAPMDLQDLRAAADDAEGLLMGPRTIDPMTGIGDLFDLEYDLLKSIVVDLSRFFANPIPDLKALLPTYQTQNGDFRWNALAYDEWMIPDPNINGILPNIMSGDDLKRTIDLEGVWDDGARDIVKWLEITEGPTASGELLAVADTGFARWIAKDYASEAPRPSLPPQVRYSGPNALTINRLTGEFVAVTPTSTYTRPEDAATPWTLRTSSLCCLDQITQSPIDDRLYGISGGQVWEISSDFAQIAPLNVFLNYGSQDMHRNDELDMLMAITYDGMVFTWDLNPLNGWVQRLTLPTMQGSYYDYWAGITESAFGAEIFAITERGDLWEIPSSFGTPIDRPDVPATNVVSLRANAATGQLVALTYDGRIFTWDETNPTGPWTQRITIPRVLVP